MNTALRLLLTLVFTAVLLFCIYGFLCTFEPLDAGTQLTWRLIYGVVGAGSIGGLIVVWRR